jgi:hypothetical protein
MLQSVTDIQFLEEMHSKNSQNSAQKASAGTNTRVSVTDYNLPYVGVSVALGVWVDVTAATN